MSFYPRLSYNLHPNKPTKNLQIESFRPKGFNKQDMTKTKQKWVDAYKEYFSSDKFIPHPNSFEIIRANFGESDEEAQQNIMEFLDKAINIYPDSYVINNIPVGVIDKDVKQRVSGKFMAYKILFQTSTTDVFGNNYKEGEFLVITNNVKIDKKTGAVSVIRSKELTPGNMGLVSSSYTSANQLLEKVKQYIDQCNLPENYKRCLLQLPNDILNYNSTKFKDFEEYKHSNVDIICDTDKNLFEDIDALSVANIQNDYGEILTPILLFTILENIGTGLKYPTSGNEQLLDFYFDENKISEKGGQGSSPSADSIIRYINKFAKSGEITFEEPKEKEFNEKIIKKWTDPEKIDNRSTVYNTTITLAHEHINDKESGYSFLLSALHVEELPTREEILNFMDNLSQDKKEFESFISAFLQKSKYTSRNISGDKYLLDYIEKRDVNDSSRIGLIFYPIKAQLIKYLNDNYKDVLTYYIQKISDINQITLDIDIKGKLTFKCTKFNNSQFIFDTKSSMNEPFHSNICIKLKNKI